MPDDVRTVPAAPSAEVLAQWEAVRDRIGRAVPGGRIANILIRAGYDSAAKIAATPDAVLLDLKEVGPGLVAVVRAAIPYEEEESTDG